MAIGRGFMHRGSRVSPFQFVMLLVLRRKPMYGYEIVKALRDEFGDVWTPQTGTVYPAIKRLEDRGLIASETREGTEYYSLTPEGEKYVQLYVTHIPGDLRFMIHYFQLLEGAVKEVRGDRPAEPESPDRQKLLRMFEGEDLSPQERIKLLREMREELMSKLASIQVEIEELERKIQESVDDKRTQD